MLLTTLGSAAFGQTAVVLDPFQVGNAGTEAGQINACGDYAYKIDNWDGNMSGAYPSVPATTDGGTAEIFKLTATAEHLYDVQGIIQILGGVDGFSWSIQSPYTVCAVIVKGGPAAQVYYYDNATTGSGLVAPINPNNGTPYGVSHVTFVFSKVNTPKCYVGDTAWSYGPRYINRGNWATYTPYVAGNVVTIYAGQTKEAGTATFSAAVNGEVIITIALNSTFRLQEVAENVKIQDYATAPSGNPSPGGFAYKSTQVATSFSVTVLANNFYGIHLDVESETPCPVPVAD